MFRNVPACSGMFHVRAFIDAQVERPIYDAPDKQTHLITGQCKTQTADCRLRTRGKMQTECKMQAAD